MVEAGVWALVGGTVGYKVGALYGNPTVGGGLEPSVGLAFSTKFVGLGLSKTADAFVDTLATPK
jgi:hypothetical protein